MSLTMKIKRNQDQLVEELVTAVVEAKKAEAEAKARLEDAQERLTEYMAAHQRKTLSKDDGGKFYRLTYVQNVTTSINEEGLKKALGARVFNKLTTSKLDRKKLSDAMDNGTVDPYVVGGFVTEKPSKAFIKVTEGVKKDSEEE